MRFNWERELYVYGAKLRDYNIKARCIDIYIDRQIFRQIDIYLGRQMIVRYIQRELNK